MKHLLSLLIVAIVATGSIALTACNTVKGVGQDVSAGGRDLSKAANTVERKINN
jgi:predicted small secreted protein